MSTRGTNFLHQWISNNVPKTNGADIISVADLTEKLFADAKAVGISSAEIEEDTGSVYEAILDAIVHYEPGLVDWSDDRQYNLHRERVRKPYWRTVLTTKEKAKAEAMLEEIGEGARIEEVTSKVRRRWKARHSRAG
jgi:hypothetical protein